MCDQCRCQAFFLLSFAGSCMYINMHLIYFKFEVILSNDQKSRSPASSNSTLKKQLAGWISDWIYTLCFMEIRRKVNVWFYVVRGIQAEIQGEKWAFWGCPLRWHLPQRTVWLSFSESVSLSLASFHLHFTVFHRSELLRLSRLNKFQPVTELPLVLRFSSMKMYNSIWWVMVSDVC